MATRQPKKKEVAATRSKAGKGKVILFGGGDGGGIRMGPDGVTPIPPFDPALRHQLRALHSLARAGQFMSEREQIQLLGQAVAKLTRSVLTQVERAVGDIDGEQGLVFQDDDGGFTCGSTGGPPVPFPFPVDPRKTVGELTARGILTPRTVNFLERASQHKIDVFEAAKDPQAAAKKMGVALSPEIEKSLLEINRKGAKPDDPVDLEVVKFYRKVVHDGRYLNEWVVNPAAVGKKLRVRISAEAIERIRDVRDVGVSRPGGTVMSPYAVAVAVAIVIVLWSREMDLPVLDASGVSKL